MMRGTVTPAKRIQHALAWATGLALLLALPIAAVLDNGGEKVQMRKVVDGYVVDLSFPVAPRHAGDNPVFVKLSTAGGEPAAGATVSVAATPQTGGMSHRGGGHGGGEAKRHDSGDTMDMGGEHDHMNMATGKSDGQMHMEGMDMNGANSHMNMEGMDMGEGHDHMDMSSPHKRSVTPAPRARGDTASRGTVLRPGRAPGIHRGLISLRAGEASKMDVSFALAGTAHAASFDVDIARQRPRALVFGGFAAANFLVMIAALIVRRREKAARLRRFG